MAVKQTPYVQWKDLAILFLPVFFVLHEWNARFASLNYPEMIRALAFYCLVSISIYIVCRLLIKDRSFAYLYGNIMGFTFFFFGKFLDLFDITRFSRIGIAVVILVFFLMLILQALKKRKQFIHWLNVFYLFLLSVYVLIEIGALSVNIINDKPGKTIGLAGSNKPDVYLLVMDEYASSEALLKYFDYDNYRFDSFLRINNFTVIGGSKSNYNFTMFSVAGMLNATPLHSFNPANITDKDYLEAYKKIRNSYIQDLFEQNGYEIKNYSCFNLRGNSTKYDINIPAFGTGAIYYQTLAGRLQPLLEYYFGREEWQKKSYRKGYQERMDVLAAVKNETAGTGRPKFVYMHLLAPHPPFYTDSLGNLKTAEADYKASMHKDVKAYTSYLAYWNKKLEELVGQIRSKTRREAVIVLMGDHGLRKYDLSSPANEHHFMNMMAVHLPARYSPKGNFPKTPVNLFPFILNSVFDTGIPYQPDSSVFLSLKPGTQVKPE